MKKVFFVFFSVTIVLFLASCSLLNSYFVSDEKIEKEIIINTLSAMENEDADEFKSLFSKNCIKNVDSLDSLIVELFEYFSTTVESYDNWGGGVVDTLRDDDKTVKTFWITLDIETKTEPYRMMIMYVSQDDYDIENIGINSLYIIKAVDDFNIDFAYWGDGKDSIGINIGIKNDDKVEDMK